jgi:hypothetical protein
MMRLMHLRTGTLVVATMLVLIFGITRRAHGESIGIYTFEQFGRSMPPPEGPPPPLAITPMIDVAPDVGLSTLRADFTSSPVGETFYVSTFYEHSVVSGNVLLSNQGLPFNNVLTVTVNTFLTGVSLAFITAGSLPTLILTSPAGSTSATSTHWPIGYHPGGMLEFRSATPFNVFHLTVPGDSGFAIDNLSLTAIDVPAVPEPTTLVLLGSGLIGVYWRTRRRAAR